MLFIWDLKVGNGCLFLALNYRQLLRFIMVFYFELRQNCAIFYFRHKKSPSIIRNNLILKLFDGGSCAIRTRDHRIKSAFKSITYRFSQQITTIESICYFIHCLLFIVNYHLFLSSSVPLVSHGTNTKSQYQTSLFRTKIFTKVSDTKKPQLRGLIYSDITVNLITRTYS